MSEAVVKLLWNKAFCFLLVGRRRWFYILLNSVVALCLHGTCKIISQSVQRLPMMPSPNPRDHLRMMRSIYMEERENEAEDMSCHLQSNEGLIFHRSSCKYHVIIQLHDKYRGLDQLSSSSLAIQPVSMRAHLQP